MIEFCDLYDHHCVTEIMRIRERVTWDTSFVSHYYFFIIVSFITSNLLATAIRPDWKQWANKHILIYGKWSQTALLQKNLSVLVAVETEGSLTHLINQKFSDCLCFFRFFFKLWSNINSQRCRKYELPWLLINTSHNNQGENEAKYVCSLYYEDLHKRHNVTHSHDFFLYHSQHPGGFTGISR